MRIHKYYLNDERRNVGISQVGNSETNLHFEIIQNSDFDEKIQYSKQHIVNFHLYNHQIGNIYTTVTVIYYITWEHI